MIHANRKAPIDNIPTVSVVPEAPCPRAQCFFKSNGDELDYLSPADLKMSIPTSIRLQSPRANSQKGILTLIAGILAEAPLSWPSRKSFLLQYLYTVLSREISLKKSWKGSQRRTSSFASLLSGRLLV